MATLQVRSIEDQLYEALGRKAAMDNRSISQEVIAILKESLSRPIQDKGSTDKFLELCGTWKDDRSAEEIASQVRGDRQSTRRFKDIF